MEKNKTNRAITGITKNKEARIILANTRELVYEAVMIHKASPLVSAALGRLLTAGLMMGAKLKGEDDLISLIIKGDGPIGGLTVTADSKGNVKGYADNPYADLAFNEKGKIDVGRGIGRGQLTVINDIGLKQPYSGTVNLVNGEIGDDLTHYFAESEQTPSVVALGVLTSSKEIIKQAGGFIIQLLPFASEKTIATIEKNVGQIESVTGLFEAGNKIEDIMHILMKGLGVDVIEEKELRYYCNCSRERVKKAIISLGKEELLSMIEDNEPIESQCHFCNKKYVFGIEELSDLLKEV